MSKKVVSIELENLQVDNFLSAFNEDFTERREFPFHSYLYEQYSLSELVKLAKEGKDVKDEFIKRITKTVLITTKKLCTKNKYLAFGDVYVDLEKTALKSIQVFNPDYQIPFPHLLRSMLKLECKSLEKQEAVRYKKESCIIVPRKYNLDDYQLNDSGTEYVNNLLMQIDLDTFLSTLSPIHKEIFFLYCNSYSLRQISQIVKMPPATVSYWVYKLTAKAKKFFKIN